jgi:branched-chain amino acid transport system substrate-binding protein
VWHHELNTPASKAFTAAFIKRYGKPPENHAWVEYVSVKILAQAMNATKSTDTDKLIAYLESGAQFDLLKARKGYFRAWDHQMMQEAYPFTVKAKGQAKDKYDFLKFGDAVPGPNQPLELLAPTKADNTCKM